MCMTLLFAILTKSASFRSYGTFIYLLRAHICNINICMYITKVYSRSVDPWKLRVGVKYYVVHSCIHLNHILRLLVCMRTARANCAQKCVCFAAVYFAFFFRGGQANPIQTSLSKCCTSSQLPMLTSYEVILFFYVLYT